MDGKIKAVFGFSRTDIKLLYIVRIISIFLIPLVVLAVWHLKNLLFWGAFLAIFLFGFIYKLVWTSPCIIALFKKKILIHFYEDRIILNCDMDDVVVIRSIEISSLILDIDRHMVKLSITKGDSDQRILYIFKNLVKNIVAPENAIKIDIKFLKQNLPPGLLEILFVNKYHMKE